MEEACRLFRKAFGGKIAEERQKHFRKGLKIVTDIMLVYEKTRELHKSSEVMKCLFLSYPISSKTVDAHY